MPEQLALHPSTSALTANPAQGAQKCCHSFTAAEDAPPPPPPLERRDGHIDSAVLAGTGIGSATAPGGTATLQQMTFTEEPSCLDAPLCQQWSPFSSEGAG